MMQQLVTGSDQYGLFDDALPSQIRIDQGITVPTSKVPTQRIKWDRVKAAIDFEAMRIGDSFAIHPDWIDGCDILRLQNFLSGAACTFRDTRVPGTWEFTTRQMADGSVRCWRIEPGQGKGRGH